MADPTSPEDWEELARKIASSEVEDPHDAAEAAKMEKAIKKRVRTARLAMFLASFLIFLFGSFLLGFGLFLITMICAEENLIANGFGWWNSFYIGAVVLLTLPGAKTALNYRNDA